MGKHKKETYTLVIAKLVGCGGCERFNDIHREDLLSDLEDESDLRVIELLFGAGDGGDGVSATDAMTGEPYKGHINPNIRDHIAWFPTFVLVCTSDFSTSGALKGLVYNEEVSNGRKIPGSKPLTATSIAEWVVEETEGASDGNNSLSADKHSEKAKSKGGYVCNNALLCSRNSKFSDNV